MAHSGFAKLRPKIAKLSAEREPREKKFGGGKSKFQSFAAKGKSKRGASY